MLMKKLKKLLKKLPWEERQSLCEILDADSAKPKHIIESLRWNSQSVFGHVLGSEPSYRNILEQTFEKLGIEDDDYWHSKKDLEIMITQHVFQAGLEKMSAQERKEFEKELHKISSEFDKTGDLAGSASLFTALGAAKLSGFGVYLLASSTLGALSGAAGLAIPFAFYTTISSTIAVVIGPIGWISAGLFAVWKLTGANYKKLIPAIVFIAAARAKLEGGFE